MSEGIYDGMIANPEGIVEKGGTVQKLAKQCLDEIKAVESEANKIKDAWDDSASSAYVAQIKEYVPVFEDLQTQIDQIGNILIRHGNHLIEDRDGLASRAEDL